MTTNASQGVRAALARSASGAVIALGELAADDIIAGLSDETKAQLATKLGASAAPAVAAAPTPSAAAGDGKDDKKMEGSDDQDDDDEPGMMNKPKDKASAADRVKAVNASDAAKANPAAALAILADDDYASLSAEAVIKLVGMAPAPSAAAGDDDAVGRQMLANMAASNPDLGAGDVNPAAEANHGWDTIHSEIQERRARK